MGLIKAAAASISGTMADQWKEYFTCDALPMDVLVIRGKKQTSKRSQNRGNDNVISNGSGIAVADGQCMIITDQGEVVEICTEPGLYTYDKSSEPSILVGNLGSAVGVIKTMVKRFTYGGDTAADQRVYYFNIKEIMDNKFGTANAIPFRVVDERINLDIDVSLRCFGVYSYRIENPILFYKNVCGNVKENYKRSEIDSQLKTEFIGALQPALGKLSELGLRPNQIVTHTIELQDALNVVLSKKWGENRGINVIEVALGSVTLPPEDAQLIKNAQNTAILRDPGMAGATLVGAQAEALKAAAANENGAITGLMGIGMINGMGNAMGGMNAQNFYNMAAQNNAQAASAQAAPAKDDSWMCSCGNANTGKFCTACGSKKPDLKGWTCACGTTNMGNFCPNCGAKKPAGTRYRCDKCGWEPEDPTHPPKFCPECGDVFDENDRV